MAITNLDQILDDDLFVVTDGDNGHKSVTGAQVKTLFGPPPPPPWEGHDGGIWHIRVWDSIKLTGGPFTAWDPDGKNERELSTIPRDTEVVFITPKNCHRLFQGTIATQNSTSFEFKDLTDTSKVTDMSYMFYQAQFLGSSYTSDPNIDKLDTSSVTNMDGMFYQARHFNLDLSSFDVSNVTSMVDMFNGVRNYTYPLDGWNVSNVENFEAMFYETQYNSSISQWDTSSATNMDYMFDNNDDFNQDLSEWCVSKIPRKPTDFSSNSSWSSADQPQWGTCP